MKLRLLIPMRVLVDQETAKIVAEGEHGAFCLLPRHVDFLAALVPGILAYADEDGNERFAAVDEGVLVKRGDEVLISTRQAVLGDDLEELEQTVREEFAALDERERAANAATAKLEASFLRSFMKMAGDRR